MAIDGLIIVDNLCHPIIQSGFREKSITYPLLHLEALNSALDKASRPGDVDSVISVSSSETDSSSAVCHMKVEDLRLLCPVSGQIDSLYVFAFMQTFVDILREYFGIISAEVIRENFDIVYQLLEETLDAGGHPSTTSPNALKDIVLPPSFLHKMLSVAGVSGLANPGHNTHPFASPIPWRKSGVRHNNNEIFFDIREQFNATVNKNGALVTSAVWGRIDSNCKLSGIPDLVLSFTNPHQLTDCSFHPCVRLQRWARDKHLSFVPPDGRFTLMDYRYAPNSLHQTPVPFTLKPDIQLEENGGTIEVILLSRLSTHIMENVVAQLYLGEGISSASCTTSNNASWSFDSQNRTLQWEIKAVPPSSNFTLRGSFVSSLKHPRPSRAFRVKFDINQHSFSALKVDQLKMTGELYKPYKGVRGRSSGDVEWRW